jgi:hypothetical protein
MPAPYASVPAKKSNKALLIVAVIAVVVIVIVAAAAALAGNKSSTNNSNNSGANNNNANSNTATNSQIGMTVSSLRGYHSQEMYVQASEGNILVMVYANITNKGVMLMYVSPVYLTLKCSDGNSYSWSYKGDYFASKYLGSGESMAIYCTFEIPANVIPTTLRFDDSVDSINVAISTNIIDLTIHQYVTITNVSVSDTTSGNQFITPDAGNKFVKVTLTLKNELSSELTLYTSYFKLYTSDGLTHDVTYLVDYTVPDGLQPGASATIVVAFEISQSTTPTKLLYNDYINSLTIQLRG